MELIMKLLFLSILVLSTIVGLGQTKQHKTPVEILYGPVEPSAKPHGPLISGVLNMKATLDTLPAYPQRAKDMHIEGRVEIQVLVNEDGEVIFANPLSGPEALWAESVKAAVAARFQPSTLAREPVKVTGRLIFDFKKGKLELPYKNGFTG
jgi:TonB family protein